MNIQPDLTGGTDSLAVSAFHIWGFVLNTQERMFCLLMGLALLSTYFARNLQRTRIGRAFAAIRDNDLAAEIMGIEVFRYKPLAFFLCSVHAGLVGALYTV